MHYRSTMMRFRWFKATKSLSRKICSPLSTRALSTKLRSPTPADAEEFLKLMDSRQGSVVTDNEILKAHNQDWSNKWKGQSRIMLRPKSTQEVASILKYCNTHRIGVVPQAGNTGLVGGSVPMRDEVIVSVQSMNKIEGLDEASGILKCEAGCVLQDLQTYAAKYDYMFPLDIGAKGSCCIGGNVSTSAGGQYFRRYGSMHANVLGLEVALPDGRIMDLMKSVNLKDNTGYDLKHLFIGAEGTLGIVTRVALLCPRLPKARDAAFLACNDFESVQKLLVLAKDMLGEVLAGFEYMDKAVLDLVSVDKRIPVTRDGEENYPHCVLVETQGTNQEHDSAKMEAFLEKATVIGLVADGVLSQDQSQVLDMWGIREYCGPASAKAGYIYKYDLSIPISDFEQFIREMRERLDKHSEALVVNWAHIRDSDLHLNVVTPGIRQHSQEIQDLLEPFIFESVVRRGGSISAEHGLGRCKNEYLTICKGETELSIMSSVKNLFDPNGIMNPGKVL